MEQLRIYRIEDKYVRFLKVMDSRVQDNKNKRRPYVGVVLLVGSYRYFVPMESPKPSHAKIKAGRHIMKLDNGKLGLLGFNNMIPVPDSALIAFDIDAEPDADYARISFAVRLPTSTVPRSTCWYHASRTYYGVVAKHNSFLMGICCDFQKLERACDRYDPNHVRKKTVGKNINQ